MKTSFEEMCTAFAAAGEAMAKAISEAVKAKDVAALAAARTMNADVFTVHGWTKAAFFAEAESRARAAIEARRAA